MQKTLKKSISILLSILMIVGVFTIVPISASAETITTVTNSHDISINSDTTITGTASNTKITVTGDCTIILDGLNLTNTSNQGKCGIDIKSGTVNLIIKGENKITAGGQNGDACPIGVRDNATLIISGYNDENDGNILTVIGTTNGKAAIGGAWDQWACGTIVINSGTINATGGGYGASVIGKGGNKNSTKSVTINGGVITTTLKDTQQGATAIGGGNMSVSYSPSYDTPLIMNGVTVYPTVTWMNYDGTELKKDEIVAEGTTPSYDGATPEKAEDDNYTYTFSGWTDGTTNYGLTDTLPVVTGNVTYTAQYTATFKGITSDELHVGNVIDAGTPIRFLMKSIGSEWQTISLQVYLDGEKVKDLQVQEASTTEPDRYYTPTKKCIVESYTCNRPTGSNQHTEHILRLKSVYDVTWKNDDGTELEKDENIVIGTTPSYDGEAPTKAEDNYYTYTFAGWNDGQTTYGLSDTLPAVSGDVTYTATFTPIAKPHEHDGVSFVPWTSTNSLPTEAGNYVLTSDVTLSGTWTVPAGETNLCLNGHGIKRTGDGNVITVSSDASLTLYDCDRTTTHYYTIASPTGNGAGLATVGESGTAFTGGYITGGNNSNGGGVVVQGTFTMNAGTIIGNNASNTGGGVFAEAGGSFNMNDGALVGNTAQYGGGVGSAAGDSKPTSLVISGGTVAYNRTTGTGGGVHTNANGRTPGVNGTDLTIDGPVKIINNHTNGVWNNANAGGGVVIDGSGIRFNLSGNPVIKDNTAGSADSPNNLYFYNRGNPKVNISGTLTNDNRIGVTMRSPGVFTTGYNTYHPDDDPADYFTSDDTNYLVKTDFNGEAQLRLNGSSVASVTVGETTIEYASFAEALSAWTNGSTLTLLADVSISSTIGVSGTKTLDLNGYGIKTAGGVAITVNNSANLTMKDSAPTRTGTGTNRPNGVEGGYLTGFNGGSNSACVVINAANFTMDGGSITGNIGKDNGAGVMINKSANLVMNGGSITNNKAGVGAGIYCQSTGKVTMTGGIVSDNVSTSADARSGGMLIHGSLTMTGGTVTRNTIGVRVWQRASVVNLSGNARITDNTVNGTAYGNLDMSGGQASQNCVKVTGTLGDDALIGITMKTPGVFTNSTDTSLNDASKFFSDNSSYIVGKNAAGQLLLSVPRTVTWKNDDGTELEKDENVAVGTTPTYNGTTPTKAADDSKHYTFAGWNDGQTTYAPNEALPQVSGNVTYTAQFTGTDHAWDTANAVWDAEPEFYADPDNYGEDAYKANVTVTCTDCQKTKTFTASTSGRFFAIEEVSSDCEEGTGSYTKVTVYATINGTDISHEYHVNEGPVEHEFVSHVAAKEATYEADGNIEYWQCAVCRKYFSDEDCNNEITQAQTVIPKLKKLFTGHSVTLGGDIGVNFFLNPAVLDTYDGTKKTVKFTVDGKETTVAVPATAEAKGYVVTCNVVAAQMAHKISAVVYAGGTALDQTDSYSVQDYAEAVYAEPGKYLPADEAEKAPALKALAAALLHYGGEAQTVFASSLIEHPDRADSNLDEAADYTGVNAAAVTAKIKGTASDLNAVATDLNAKYHTNSLIYLQNNTLRVYFTPTTYPADMPNAGAYDGNLSNYYYYKDKANIAAAELDDQQDFTVGNVSFKYSPLNYVVNVLNSSNMNTKQKNLAKSLFLYNQAANAYFDEPVIADDENIVDLSTLTAAYEAQNNDVLTGELKGDYQITIADGATVTLRDANITCLSNDSATANFAGITPLGDATILLEGENTVKGGYRLYPGIYVPADTTLTIDGEGSLDASSNGSGSGIGGGNGKNAGNIIINGGTITATGGEYAAGIGGGGGSKSGDITITGGTVTANGGRYGSGIGSSYYGKCGNITIAGTVTQVTATMGEDATNSIGAGESGSCGTVSIADPSKVTQN